MKRILDASFRYKPSFDTDIRKTFERARRQQRAAAQPVVKVNVLPIDKAKKAGER